MLAQVEPCTRVDPLHFFESERHLVLDVGSRVGIVCQLIVIVEAVLVRAKTKSLVPFHPYFFPVFEPIQLFTRYDEELHLHLLELPHAEDKLACHDLVTERFPDLRDPKRHFHAPGLLHVQEVHEYPLRALGPQVYFECPFGGSPHLGREHQVKLPHFRPITGATHRAGDFAIHDNLPQLVQVIVVQCLGKTRVNLVPLRLIFQHPGIGFAVHLLVELLPEALCRLLHLLVDLIVYFSQILLDQHVGTIPLLAVPVIDQWIIKRVHVSRCFPDGRVHEDGGVDPYNILVQQHHAVPPIFFQVVLELHAHLPVIINGA